MSSKVAMTMLNFNENVGREAMLDSEGIFDIDCMYIISTNEQYVKSTQHALKTLFKLFFCIVT